MGRLGEFHAGTTMFVRAWYPKGDKLFSMNLQAYDLSTDLRALLRGGYSDEEIANVWRRAMWGKKPGHGINDPSFLSPDRPMSAIGG